mmetsp:Transcript_5114/g.11357  ORF Transcript_5114/g.11357 Transcript_5114/m.11357 type:complete len:250 (+) Transcript_5114:1077-1826(+)
MASSLAKLQERGSWLAIRQRFLEESLRVVVVQDLDRLCDRHLLGRLLLGEQFVLPLPRAARLPEFAEQLPVLGQGIEGVIQVILQVYLLHLGITQAAHLRLYGRCRGSDLLLLRLLQGLQCRPCIHLLLHHGVEVCLHILSHLLQDADDLVGLRRFAVLVEEGGQSLAVGAFRKAPLHNQALQEARGVGLQELRPANAFLEFLHRFLHGLDVGLLLGGLLVEELPLLRAHGLRLLDGLFRSGAILLVDI